KMAKKNKNKITLRLPVDELMRRTEAAMLAGDLKKALDLLQEAEVELRPRTNADGKPVTASPQVVAGRVTFPALKTRVLTLGALSINDPARQDKQLAEAAATVPEDARPRLAHGALRLLRGDHAAAARDFAAAATRPLHAESTSAACVLASLAGGDSAAGLPHEQSTEQHNMQTRRAGALAEAAQGRAVTGYGPLMPGLACLIAGDTARASEHLSELQELSGSPAGADAAAMALQFYYSGALAFGAGKNEDALGAWRDAVRLIDAAPVMIQARLRDALRGGLHAAARQTYDNDPGFSIDCWREALRLRPEDAAATANIAAAARAAGVRAWRTGDHKHAAAIWTEALLASPRDETLLHNTALALEKLDRRGEALTHWRTLAGLWQARAKQSDAAFNARLLRLQKNILRLMAETKAPPETALPEIESALKLAPGDEGLLRQNIGALIALDRPRPALKLIQSHEQRGALSLDMTLLKASVHVHLDQPREARQLFERAMQMDPASLHARHGLLKLLEDEVGAAINKGYLAPVVALIQKQLELDPQYETGLERLAGIHLFEKNKPAARTIIDRLIAIEPGKPRLHVRAGEIYLNHKMKKEATAAFTQAIQIAPEPETFYNIGIAYWETDNPKDAFRYFDRVAATENVEFLSHIVSLLIDEEDNKNAARYLATLERIDPDNPLTYLQRVMTMFPTPASMSKAPAKKIEEAHALLEKAEQIARATPRYAHMLSLLVQTRRVFEITASGGPALNLASLSDLAAILGLGDDFPDGDDFFEALPKRRKRR
ncbi:MAG: hypothetical protein ACKV2V_07895, partial [Blastocatellia bacterium]